MKKVWKYPDEITDFVREHGHEGSVREMQERVNSRFGTSFTYDQMKSMFSRHKIHAAPRLGRKYPDKRITTPEMDTFIREHLEGTGYQSMADLLNARFGTSFTKDQMKNYYSRNKLDSGLTGRFEKGSIPANKGKTWDEFMSPESQAASRRTTFKPGHLPHNGGTPVGTIRLRHGHRNRPGSHPYYWQKVAEPNVWRMKHAIEWEEHNGPVPEGRMVTFANGDTLDWRIDNLILETKAQHAVKNRHHIHGYDQESALTANQIADIKIAVSRKKKRRKGGKDHERNHS